MAEMPQYKVNAPGGCYIEGKGIQAEGSIITLPAWIEPRNTFIPQNKAAQDVFDAFNKGKPEEIEAEIKGLELKGLDAQKYRTAQLKLRTRKPNAPIQVIARRPTGELAAARAALEELEARDAAIMEQKREQQSQADALAGRASPRTADK